MKNSQLLIDLQQKNEMDPNTHDGCYRICQELVGCYAQLEDLSSITVNDLNALYLSVIGTWKVNVQLKKEKINLTCLPDTLKQYMRSVIDEVWDNACNKKYENVYEKKPNVPSIGMFGTGFMSFKTPNNLAGEFIKMCIDVYNSSSDEEALNHAEKTLSRGITGMKAASVSVILHVLKPLVFPIINTNAGNGTVFEALGIELDRPYDETTYIANTRVIKAFRDANLPYKNYRVLDMAAWHLDKYVSDSYWPLLKDYDPNITTEQYLKLIKDTDIIPLSAWKVPYLIYKVGGESTCKNLAKKYGKDFGHYNSLSTSLAKKVYQVTNCALYEENSYWQILYRGKDSINKEDGSWIWRLREPLWQAIEILDAEGYFLGAFDDKKEGNIMKIKHNLNTILYGPPGTGKTYHTVIYAVAYIENKSIEDIEKESYDSIKSRFEQYKNAGQIVFTTFHQSYGYEEFIEGIKPVVIDNENTDNSDIAYEVKPGIFKSFCDSAVIKNVTSVLDFDDNYIPRVWKVSLEKTGDNPTRKECLDNDHIRIGWDEYGPEFNSDSSYPSGKSILNAFINQMQIGDIVVSCYSSSETDAIGVITGEYEWDNHYEHYKRVRKVKWIVKNIREDIVGINNGTKFTLATIYKTKISVKDIVNLIAKYTEINNHEEKNYVFIIDEINRGNISKIFGELITLIEDTKREGKNEATSIVLPYSGESFSIPSNVYILGTMNTADRSIALMDTALRRRFSFVEMMPESSVLENNGAHIVKDKNKVLNVAEMLDVINKRIEFLFDREHTIGHAFFMPLKEEPTIKQLATIFRNKIIPLLQEYFYDDYEKIQLVLGDNQKSDAKYCFISSNKRTASIFKGKPELEQVISYSVNYEAFENIESYIEIINQVAGI